MVLFAIGNRCFSSHQCVETRLIAVGAKDTVASRAAVGALESVNAYMVLGIVFKFDQWFIPRICHAVGEPFNADDCDCGC